MLSFFSTPSFLKNLGINTCPQTCTHTHTHTHTHQMGNIKDVHVIVILTSIFQIYTGRYRNPREREAPVEIVDDFFATLNIGCFVALYFDNYDKEPVIGKVLSIEENQFQVHYWKGTYLGKWSPQHLPWRKTEPWLERLPKTCIVCSSFQLNEDSKLMPATRNFLKERYAALRNSRA